MRRSTECFICGLLLLIVANTMHNAIAALIESVIAVMVIIIGSYHSGKEREK